MMLVSRRVAAGVIGTRGMKG